MPKAYKSNLLLYADDFYFAFQRKGFIKTEKQLKGDFTNICEWFVDNRFSIRFGGNKTKCIFLASKRKIKNVSNPNITYKTMQTKQNSKVTHLYVAY